MTEYNIIVSPTFPSYTHYISQQVMGPAARDKPNDNIEDFPDEGSDDQRGSPGRSPTPPIGSYADRKKPYCKTAGTIGENRR